MKIHPVVRSSRKLLKESKSILKKMKGQIPISDMQAISATIEELEQAIISANEERISEASVSLKQQLKSIYASSHKTKELLKTLLFAFIIAFVIRQFWFEFYEVPTGSMRPTIMEQDRIVVSKTTFGLRIPFISKPLFFKEKAIQRGSLVVFTIKGMNISDSDTRYFGIFPGKKRYVKRCVGKPGDMVYFYGGKLYIVDKNSQLVTEESDPNYLKQYGLNDIKHVPFINFDGTPEIQPKRVIFKQMNQPLGKIVVTDNLTKGFFFANDVWNKDSPHLIASTHTKPVSYTEMMGMNNFAVVQIVSRDPSSSVHRQCPSSSSDSYYLRMDYGANLTYPSPSLKKMAYDPLSILKPYSTYLKLTSHHIEKIRRSLTTARFVVSKERAFRYYPKGRFERFHTPSHAISLSGIPDGCYEFENGIPYSIHFGGIRTVLKHTHPLTDLNNKQVIRLFNFGINFHRQHEINENYHALLPQRFAFYNEGNLYVMDVPLFFNDDPEFKKFQQNEMRKRTLSSQEEPYIGFTDSIPLADPNLSKEEQIKFIKNFGFKVPDNHILVLGDNYTMSADSREFGCVPTENLIGAPLYRFWPLGPRLGRLNQIPYPTSPITVVIICGLFTGFFIYSKKRKNT